VLADGIGVQANTLQMQARRDGRSLLRLCDDRSLWDRICCGPDMQIGEAVEGRVHGRYRAGPQQKMIALDHSCRRTVFRFLGAKVF
jgi:hypothetical protein